MELFTRLVAAVNVALHWITAPSNGLSYEQQHTLAIPQFAEAEAEAPPILYQGDGKGGPVFAAPGDGPLVDDFVCDYSAMGPDWKNCSTPTNRGCWLQHKNGTQFNITSDYENLKPQGIDRYYKIETNDGWINADGINFTEAKLFNNQYPGPLIQACWGDTVHVQVVNKMQYNGTSIHWHGIRQLNTMHMDGVNGITQCPIAPGDHFNYTFETLQYGTTWYHSHYSVQYADGLQGPITIHGPKSANYDEAVQPLMMSDWGHNSAFNAIHRGGYLEKPSLLLNGIGNRTRFDGKVPPLPIKPPYELDFDSQFRPQIDVEDVEDISEPGKPKKYLLRLINTSFGATFIFSIDNHWLQVVSSDLVPIHPYLTTSVLVGIGQRYNVIVEAEPKDEQPDGALAPPLPKDGNFWIRNWVADKCGTKGGVRNYERVGIIRYNEKDRQEPTSNPWYVPKRCSDEPYGNLSPMLPWTVGHPANSKSHESPLETFRVNLTTNANYTLFPIAAFSLQPDEDRVFMPLQVQYSDPMFLHMNNFVNDSWPGSWVVVPENYTEHDWVYLLLAGDKGEGKTTGAHPIHLHGHDFAILQQVEDSAFDIANFNPKLNNPPRRDVVLLPRNGWVVIAFKADNPGSWLMHCHIATHASEGLALQVLERQKDANDLWPHNSSSKAIPEAQRLCKNWKDWYGNCTNYWPGVNESTGINPSCSNQYFSFQDDSGI